MRRRGTIETERGEVRGGRGWVVGKGRKRD
jgi:hypothetical protein